jgi:hypothetical protein
LRLLRREHHIWRTVGDELAVRYVCWERLDGGGWAVQQCDYGRMVGSCLSEDWSVAESHRIENAIEQRPAVWHPTVEVAIASFDAEFENEWTDHEA